MYNWKERQWHFVSGDCWENHFLINLCFNMYQISTINYKLFKILAMYSWFKGLQLHVYKSIYIYIHIYIYIIYKKVSTITMIIMTMTIHMVVGRLFEVFWGIWSVSQYVNQRRSCWTLEKYFSIIWWVCTEHALNLYQFFFFFSPPQQKSVSEKH